MDLRALIFMPALVGCAICGFILALFAANYYLTILQGTAAGGRKVTWTSEPLVDNFWKVFYLGGLIVLWLGPAWLLGRAYSSTGGPLWIKYAIPLLIFWLLYPVSQISSLGGSSIWIPFHAGTIERLTKKPHLVVGFVIFSGMNLILLAIGFYWVFQVADLVWLFLGSPLLVFSWFFYARLLGRLAFAISYTDSFFENLGRDKKRRKDSSGSKLRGRKKKTGVVEPAEKEETISIKPGEVQPSDLPPIMTPDDGLLHGYNVKFIDEPIQPTKRIVAEMIELDTESKKTEPQPDNESQSFTKPKIKPNRKSNVVVEEDNTSSYEMNSQEMKVEKRIPQSVIEPSALEMKLLSRDDAPKPPTHVWSGELFVFLLQPETITSGALLTVICTIFGGLVRLAQAFNPASDGP